MEVLQCSGSYGGSYGCGSGVVVNSGSGVVGAWMRRKLSISVMVIV